MHSILAKMITSWMCSVKLRGKEPRMQHGGNSDRKKKIIEGLLDHVFERSFGNSILE